MSSLELLNVNGILEPSRLITIFIIDTILLSYITKADVTHGTELYLFHGVLPIDQCIIQ